MNGIQPVKTLLQQSAKVLWRHGEILENGLAKEKPKVVYKNTEGHSDKPFRTQQWRLMKGNI